jgi:hypothetical protein
MCVIMLVQEVRPTDEAMDKAWARNGDGGGIAWRVKGKDGSLEVAWKKGLNKEELIHLMKTVPLPYVAHFRLQSKGGVRATLTHPFPIDVKAPLTLEGRTKGYVLFHNGTWDKWDEAARQAAIMSRVKIPGGRWSDSRAMAWLCAIYGNGFMEFLPDQRGIAFGPNDMDIYTGWGWKEIDKVWCSNDLHINPPVHQPNHGWSNHSSWQVCKFGQCRRHDTDEKGYCPEHQLDKDGFRGGRQQAPFCLQSH